MKARHPSILKTLLSAPTAPFHERAVIDAVTDWAKRRGAAVAADPAGNVLIRLPAAKGTDTFPQTARKGVSPRCPHWVLAAHMDHPGFVVRGRRGRTLRAVFRGSVGREYFKGARVRFFAPGGEVVGRVTSRRAIPDTPWFECGIRLNVEGNGDRHLSADDAERSQSPVPEGTIGVWDFPAARVRGRVLSSRGCDDVAGVAAVICAMDELAARGERANVTALLTRAEEAAFIGALAACRHRSVPADALIVAIETSKAQPGARLGDGVIVRVGDAARTWDPSLTAHLTKTAETLAARDRHFRFARRLMPGGVCESTAYAMYGYRASGLCLPLGNYHNQGPRGRVAAERIHLGDFASLVKLLVAIAGDKDGPGAADTALAKRLDHLLATRGKYLREGP